MSSIDAQIKALLLKKKKIDYVGYILDLVKNDTKCHDFKDVKTEVTSKIEPFLKDLMVAIESDSEVKPKEIPDALPFLSEDERKALKMVAEKVMNKNAQPPSQNDIAKIERKKQDSISTSDKMNFAMSNRHLASKRVQVLNDQNTQIFGQVVGLDAPFVVVKTDTGPVINVPIEKVVPQ